MIEQELNTPGNITKILSQVKTRMVNSYNKVFYLLTSIYFYFMKQKIELIKGTNKKFGYVMFGNVMYLTFIQK